MLYHPDFNKNLYLAVDASIMKGKMLQFFTGGRQVVHVHSRAIPDFKLFQSRPEDVQNHFHNFGIAVRSGQSLNLL